VKPKIQKSSSIVKLAGNRRYLEIDWLKITEKDVCELDSNGFTLLHYAARDGVWGLIPKKFKDKHYWREAQNGDTIYMSAFSGKDQSWIDLRDLTQEDILKCNEQGQSILSNAIAGKIFGRLPKTLITPDLLSMGERGYPKVIHSVARLGQFGHIEKKHLSHKLLSQVGDYGESVYHILALTHDMRYLPKEFVTKQVVTLKTKSGVMPLHTMAEFEWELVPKDITYADVCYPAVGKETPLHAWSRGRGWVEIPDKFLTKESLLLTNINKDTPLNLIWKQYHNLFYANFEGDVGLRKKVDNKMKKIFSKLSLRQLKEFQNSQYSILAPLIKEELVRRKAVQILKKRGDELVLEF